MSEQLYERIVTIYALKELVTRERIADVLALVKVLLLQDYTDYSGTSPVMQFQFSTPGFIKQRSSIEKKLKQMFLNEPDIHWNVSFREQRTQ